jgi:hypothetical protein
MLRVLLHSARWVTGKDAKQIMDADAEAWYPFAITDADTRVLVDSKGLPAECGGLAGKLVAMGSAMQAMEVQAGACNPKVSHHNAQKTTSGPSPYDVASPNCVLSTLRYRLAPLRSMNQAMLSSGVGLSLVRIWSLEPSSSLVYVLHGKTANVKDKKKMKKDKKDKITDKDKLKVKADCFGADLDASAVRSSRNVNVLFHVRPVCF